jgi:general secretion pathway protein G
MIDTYRRARSMEPDREADDAGFTLIELLIVIVVLGILAAVVVFSLAGVSSQGAKSACAADGRNLSIAISAFQQDNPGVTVTSALLTGSTDSGPFIQTWPANSPHYAYSISAGTLQIAVPATATPVAYVGNSSCSTAT